MYGGIARLSLIALALAGCIPRAAMNSPEPTPIARAPESPPASPRLDIDLSSLPPDRPVWEMRPVVATANAVVARSYAVRPGDTLRSIGEATGAGSDAIVRANALVAPYEVKPGQSLRIPGGRYHRVREGETGIAIARAYGTAWSRIVDANALAEPYVLRVGQRLLLPGDAVATVGTAPADIESRARAFQIGIDDIVTGSEPARATTAPMPGAAPPILRATTTATRFAWPASGTIVGRFGPQGGGRISQGIDLDAPAGSPIRASASGTVAYVGSGVPGYGGLVLLRHEGGWISAYGRIAAPTVKQGEQVRPGQPIARGTDTPLHFELRRARVPVDPLGYLPKR